MAESIIDTYKFCDDIINQHRLSLYFDYTELLQLADEFTNYYAKLKQNLPYHINIIDELHVNENANSRILSSLLLYEDRGDYPLLNSFVSYCLPNWNIEIESPIITAEEQRIDILVREKNKYAIIFENKIYDAILQKNQLARYIKKMRSEGFEDSQIYVVFLPPYYYEPDICSWQEPQKCCKACDRILCKINQNPELKDLFVDRFKVITFRDDILRWLKDEAYPNCKQREVYLSTAMVQYIDYLEGYFDLRTINKQMNMELKDFLNEKLQLNNLTDEEKLNTLDKKTEEINRLLNQINNIKEDIRQKLNNNDVDKWKLYIPKMQEIIHKVAKTHGLKAEINYVNEENSHFYIRFFVEKWELSIVLEKFEYNRNQRMFVYIGIPPELRVDSKYQYLRIFKESTEKPNHPYGWEWINKYDSKPEILQKDIENGEFELYLEETVGTILKRIEENGLLMN